MTDQRWKVALYYTLRVSALHPRLAATNIAQVGHGHIVTSGTQGSKSEEFEGAGEPGA